MIVPTIHLNGTGKEDLIKQVREAHSAVCEAIDKLYGMAPHGRDYYPQGDFAYAEARTEHLARLEPLQSVRDELMDLWQGISEAGR